VSPRARTPARIAADCIPPLLLMGVIFALSAQPDLGSGLGTAGFVARKVVHMCEYGLLWLLWLRALGSSRPAAAAVIAVLYAVTDEWHQSFVSGRHGSPVDVAIDSLGVAVAYALWRRLGARGASRGAGRSGAVPARSPES
jgi:hypothetical protein